MAKRIGRREALGALGGVSLGAFLAACSGSGDSSSGMSPSTTKPRATTTTGAGSATTATDGSLTALFDDAATCSVTPGETEGPFYLDVEKIRRDITEGTDGRPLRLALRVRDAGDCTPISDAVVDIWHADPAGAYSGVQGEDGTFLRGMQVTDADGITQFDTVYPGAYQGRTVHIHAKVHLDNSTLLTTQLYFPEGANDAVFTRPAYSSDAARDTTNADDSIFDEQMVMTVTEDGDGYLGVMTINVAV